MNYKSRDYQDELRNIITTYYKHLTARDLNKYLHTSGTIKELFEKIYDDAEIKGIKIKSLPEVIIINDEELRNDFNFIAPSETQEERNLKEALDYFGLSEKFTDQELNNARDKLLQEENADKEKIEDTYDLLWDYSELEIPGVKMISATERKEINLPYAIPPIPSRRIESIDWDIIYLLEKYSYPGLEKFIEITKISAVDPNVKSGSIFIYGNRKNTEYKSRTYGLIKTNGRTIVSVEKLPYDIVTVGKDYLKLMYNLRNLLPTGKLYESVMSEDDIFTLDPKRINKIGNILKYLNSFDNESLNELEDKLYNKFILL